jgi:hypothetical protein
MLKIYIISKEHISEIKQYYKSSKTVSRRIISPSMDKKGERSVTTRIHLLFRNNSTCNMN